MHAEHLGSRDLIEALGTEQDVLLRLCGLEALAANRSFGLFKALRAALDALPEKAGFARWRWMESSAAALHGLRNKAKSDDFRPLALAVIAWLDDKEVPEDTKLVIARHLARTFGSEHVTLKSVFWRDALDAEQSLTPPDERYVSDPPTFMGLRAWGKRIVYLIDMSDSMLEPITNEERTRLGAPITGGDEKRPKRDKKDEDGEIEVGDLPWHRIETRFDLAREYLKQSLAGLPKDRYFMVVGFGSEAETLKSTKRFVAAKKKTIRKVLKELDKIKPGRATDVRPNGTLRGDTNMHAAFRLAFQAGKKGPMRGDAALDEEGFEHGCDTIFLLSDGAPTVDDFMAVDQVPAGSGGYRDRETGKSLGGGGGAAPPPGSMVPAEIQGPYGSDDVHIVDDIRRMNLFRKAEIHCVGIGKAKMRLLKRLAEAGLGKARRFDADEDDEDEDDDE